MLVIPYELYESYQGTLEARVEAFKAALAHHATTVDEPAPIEDALVERLARSGEPFESAPPPPPNEVEPVEPIVIEPEEPQVTAGQAKVTLARYKRVPVMANYLIDGYVTETQAVHEDGTPAWFITPDPAVEGENLLELTEAVIAQYPLDIRMWYQAALHWKKSNPYVRGIALELGLTDEHLDELFFYASQLEE
ncbi:hypothetical protein GGR34_000747 [Microvirga flocculans]|uniref:Uncharacterized protein n=1 Tax=Microvirga flocculans TaxID=217168 RepID=A0A7W6ICU6_9HYPH|nr:hypothetical protein [Microvirga flocculans]MBB4039112.1 hypothetical protein [Microvirga flocculans]